MLYTIFQDAYDSEKPIDERMHAFVLVYDSTNRHTFNSMVEIFWQLKDFHNQAVSNKKTPKLKQYLPKLIIVGNKMDLIKKKRNYLKPADIEQVGDTFIKEISAFTADGVDDAFNYLIHLMDNDR